MKKTAADEYALRYMPGEWFVPCELQIRRPKYRCNRLYRLGILDRRINPKYVNTLNIRPALVEQARTLHAEEQHRYRPTGFDDFYQYRRLGGMS